MRTLASPRCRGCHRSCRHRASSRPDGASGDAVLDAESGRGTARRLGSREDHRGQEADAIRLVDDGGTVVLSAKADGAATRPRSADEDRHQGDADHRVAMEDQQAHRGGRQRRGVEGGFAGRASSSASAATGRSFRLPTASPFARRPALGQADALRELMYIWSNKAPVGTVIPNPHTNRVQMIVAASGPAGVGKWSR